MERKGATMPRLREAEYLRRVAQYKRAQRAGGWAGKVVSYLIALATI
jgi:hypothetical protein